MIPKNTSSRKKNTGWFAIGIENPLSNENIGTLWRTAQLMNASYIFTIGKNKYKRQSSDVLRAWRDIPLHQYNDLETFLASYPRDARLVGIEIDDNSDSLIDFKHHINTVYLLGSESNGLSNMAKTACHDLIYVPSTGCLNVSVTGSIVLYDRIAKQLK